MLLFCHSCGHEKVFSDQRSRLELQTLFPQEQKPLRALTARWLTTVGGSLNGLAVINSDKRRLPNWSWIWSLLTDLMSSPLLSSPLLPPIKAITPSQTKLSLAFCVFTSALCETVLVLFGVVCQYSLLVMASKQQQAFRMCIHPSHTFSGWGHTHSLCCLFGRGACTVSARPSPMDAPIPPGTISRGRSGLRSPGLWSRCCRGTAKAAVLGFAKGSVSGGDEHHLISAFT